MGYSNNRERRTEPEPGKKPKKGSAAALAVAAVGFITYFVTEGALPGGGPWQFLIPKACLVVGVVGAVAAVVRSRSR